MTRSTTLRGGLMLAVLGALGCERATEPTPDATIALEASSATSVQVATVNTAVAQAPAVRVLDAAGRPVPDRIVRFVITQGHGGVQDSTAVTDGDGIARSGSWVLGRRAGPQQLLAFVPSAMGAAHTFFSATSQPASPVRLVLAPRVKSVTVGDTLQLAWSHLDAFDNVVPSPPVPVFTALDVAKGSVDAAGRVIASALGSARFTGAIGAHIDTLRTYAYRRAAPDPYDSFEIGTGTLAVATATDGSAVLASDTYYGLTRLFRVGPRATFAADSIDLSSNSSDVAVSADGTRAYFRVNDSYAGSGIGVLDLGTMTQIGKFGTKQQIGGFSASPDGSLLFVGVWAGAVTAPELRIFLTNGNGSFEIATTSAAAVATARTDNSRAWVSLYDGSLIEVDLQAVSITRTSSTGYGSPATGLSLSPDGTRLFAATAAGVLVVDLATFTVSAPIPGTDAATDVKVTPDGSKLIVARNNTVGVLVIDANTLAHLATYSGFAARRIALDTVAGHAIVTGPSGTVQLIKY